MDRYRVVEQNRNNIPTILLIDKEADLVAEILPSIGNNLVRLQFENESLILAPKELDLFRQSKTACFQYGMPVLFPPNRISNGRFVFKDKEYHFPINETPHHLHGELCYKAWDVVEQGATDEQGAYVVSQFDLRKHPEIMSYFPHSYIFTLTYRIQNGQLSIEGEVRNEDDQEAPFFLGFHPYFSYSLESELTVRIVVPAEEEWPINSLAFVTDSPRESSICLQLRDGLPVSEVPLMGGWLAKINQGNPQCKILYPDQGIQIIYEIDPNFPFLLLFKPNWGSGISLEPYTCVTDAYNLPYSAAKVGQRSLLPKEKVTYRFGITACRFAETDDLSEKKEGDC